MSIMGKKINQIFGSPPTQVLHDLNFEVKDGEFVALVGRSGSGKSTLLYILSTLDKPSSGEIWIDGQEMNRLSSKEMHQFRNQYLGFVFQFHYLLPELTAIENVLLPAMKTKQQEKYRERALALLAEFGLNEKADRFPSQLSGGEQQRVAIARALVMEPKYLFADEPTGNLDTVNSEIVLKLLQKINREQRTTIVMVTHDLGFAARADRQIRLVDGRIES